MHLIVGLGNPGEKYQNTRHNLGFKVIEELARRLKINSLRSKFDSFVAEAEIKGLKVMLVQPQTFMNNSGPAVRGILSWYKIDHRNLIVICDDVDLEIGQLRIREKGGAAGHHGVESVIESTGSNEFARVRIGIGRENLTGDVSDYVLQEIPPSQRKTLDAAVLTAADAAETILSEGLAAAMNRFNQ
jgi:PTH1 family peptidyl-tRNA hydrolase